MIRGFEALAAQAGWNPNTLRKRVQDKIIPAETKIENGRAVYYYTPEQLEECIRICAENPMRKPEFFAVRDEFKIKKLNELTAPQYDAFYARLLALTSGATAAPAAAAEAEL